MVNYISKTYYVSRTNSPKCRSEKEGWLNTHQRQCHFTKLSTAQNLLIGDSIIKNFLLYPHIWQHYFTKNNYLNCGISGDSTQHVLWRAKNLTLPSTIKNIFILCGSNNVNKDSPIEIVNGIVSIGLSFIEQYKNIQVFLSGIIPRDSAVSVKRDIIITLIRCGNSSHCLL